MHVELKKLLQLPRNPLCFPLASCCCIWLLWYYGVCYDSHDHGCGQRFHAASLEPTFRELPAHCELTRRRHQCPQEGRKILDREMFVALDSTEDGLAASAKDAFGVDSSLSFAHKQE